MHVRCEIIRRVCQTIGVEREELGPRAIVAVGGIRAQAYRRDVWLLWSGDQRVLLALLLLLLFLGVSCGVCCGVAANVNRRRCLIYRSLDCVSIYGFLDLAHPILFEEIHRWPVATALATALLGFALCLSARFTRVEVRSAKAGSCQFLVLEMCKGQ